MKRRYPANEWIWVGRLHILSAVALGGLFLTVVGVAQTDRQQTPPHDQMMGAKRSVIEKAVAFINPIGTNGVQGTVTFTQENNGVRVRAHLTGLTKGQYGFHVHQYGDCSSNDGKSAGDHFNPTGERHGAPSDKERHEGDLGNIEATDSGVATADFVDLRLSLSGPNSIIGRSVVIHRNPDDLKTQPSGNSGPRIGCGVIGIAMPDSLRSAPGTKTN